MCRFEVYAFTNSDGQREQSEMSFPCDKATNGIHCANMQRRTNTYDWQNRVETTTTSRASRRTTSKTSPGHTSPLVLAPPQPKHAIIVENRNRDNTPYVRVIRRSSRRSRSETTLPDVVAATHRKGDRTHDERHDISHLDLTSSSTVYPSRPAAPRSPTPAIDFWSQHSERNLNVAKDDRDLYSQHYYSIVTPKPEAKPDSALPTEADSPSWSLLRWKLPWFRSGADRSKVSGQQSQSEHSDEIENKALQSPASRPIYKGAVSEPLMRSANETPGIALRETSPSTSRFGTGTQSVDQEKARVASTWLEYYNKAVSRVREIRISDNPNRQPVKIAILDSGLELTDEQRDDYDLSTTCVQRYKDWVHNGRSIPTDADGHGTHLTVLLRQVAPNAEIYVAKVYEKDPGAEPESQDRIAQAIRYAVDEWGVDIIVMAFGFSERHTAMDNAIRYASYKGRLMFAAASNDGRNRSDDIAWPARDANVMCIHSGDGNGTRSPFTPTSQDNMRIMVLGESVQSACPTHVDDSGLRYMSGTSCAAPIAAGIAALILDYARGFLEDEQWQTLRRTDAMRNMFKRMRDENHADYWWIKPWKIFQADRTKEWIEGEIRAAL